MPFFDYALAHGDSEQLTIERDREASDLQSAIGEAEDWAKEVRRLSGKKTDMAKWPLSIVPSATDGGTAGMPALYRAEDVRPDEWDDEANDPAAMI